MKRIVNFIRLSMLIAAMILSVFTIFAQTADDLIPMHKLEVQTALATGDISALQNEILDNLQDRGGWKVIWTHVYDRGQVNYWNNFEIHEHQYQNIHPAQMSREIVTQNTSGSWQNYMRYTPAYVSYDSWNYTSYLYENWSGGQWVNYYRTLYTYNQDDSYQTITGQMWQNSAWQNYSLSTYYYGANSRISYILSQSWTNGIWVNSVKTDYTYDSMNRVSQMIISSWIAPAWALFFRNTYTYTSEGDYNTILGESWDGTSSYVNNNRSTYSYNQYQNSQIVYESWSENAWHYSQRMLYNYDAIGNNTESIYQIYNSSWEDHERRTMEYEFWDVANEDDYASVIPLQVRLYPNPAVSSASVIINSSKSGRGMLEIYNLKGEKCSSQDVTIEINKDKIISLDTSKLPSGVYFIRTTIAGQQQTTRMLKLK
jgi:hypothetical protein